MIYRHFTHWLGTALNSKFIRFKHKKSFSSHTYALFYIAYKFLFTPYRHAILWAQTELIYVQRIFSTISIYLFSVSLHKPSLCPFFYFNVFNTIHCEQYFSSSLRIYLHYPVIPSFSRLTVKKNCDVKRLNQILRIYQQNHDAFLFVEM